MYKCGWNGCEKAYGTLNHLNAHVTMQSHGPKRTPEGTWLFSCLISRRAGTFALAGGGTIAGADALLAPFFENLSLAFHDLLPALQNPAAVVLGSEIFGICLQRPLTSLLARSSAANMVPFLRPSEDH